MQYVVQYFNYVVQFSYICTTGFAHRSPNNNDNFSSMERVTIFKRTTKKEGDIRLRFRLQDGRKADLYHKSDIVANLKELDKFTPEGMVKPKVTIYNKTLHKAITTEIAVMRKVYADMINNGFSKDGETFEKLIDAELHPIATKEKEKSTLLSDFSKFMNKFFRDGVIGKGRLAHYKVTERELTRFLIIKGKSDIKTCDFDKEQIMDYRDFLLNEYLYVEKWTGLYTGLTSANVPTKQRSTNTVAQKLNQLQSFFSTMEDEEQIDKSPFRKLGKQRRNAALEEKYDDPVFLKADEFQLVVNTTVPNSLQETKDAFLLQSMLGCRISDFKEMGMKNIAIDENDKFAYVRYLPIKTKSKSREEIETPLMRMALDIILKYGFKFNILKYVSGERGYNDKIKMLLKYCEIDRECMVFNQTTRDNEYKPLYELGSSKLCRKTHVDMMNKVQINQYAAGLHKEGSDAVNRYTKLSLHDRFILMCAAFKEPSYKVDEDLNII